MEKVEKEGQRNVVYCKFVEEKERLLLEDFVKAVEGKHKENINNPIYGNGYAERFPDQLSNFLRLEKDYKAVSLEEAISQMKSVDGKFVVSQAKNQARLKGAEGFGLTDADAMSIFIYTIEKGWASPYNAMNFALAHRKKKTLLPVREYILYLLGGLRKMHKSEGKVLYRGVRMDKSEAENIYYEGRTIFWTPFSSTSTNVAKAYKFANKFKGKEGDENKCGLIFEIHGNVRGYRISNLSAYVTEEGKLAHQPVRHYFLNGIHHLQK